MKLYANLVLGVALANTFAAALQLRKRDNPSVLGLAFEKRQNEPAFSQLEKRTQAISTQINPEGVLRYFVNYTLGSPPANLWAQLDTGSTNLIVFGPDFADCDPSGCQGGTYDPSKSTTSKFVNSNLTGRFYDNSGYSGDFYTDTLAIGGVAVPNVQVGVMKYYSSPGPNLNSIFGLGINTTDEENLPASELYPNFPLALRNAGIINTAAYSIYLNGPYEKTGTILFGGVNKAKYNEPLVTLPILADPDSNTTRTFLVGMTGLSLSLNGQEIKLPFEPREALLDSGNPALSLPGFITNALLGNISGSFDPVHDVFLAPCSAADNNATIDFSFGLQTISVALSNLLIPPYVYFQNDESLLFDGTDQCVVMVADSEFLSLGDPFFRGAYAVFDLDNLQISLAQANAGSAADDIVEIVNNVVPDATVLGGIPTSLAPFYEYTYSNANPTHLTASVTTTTHHSTLTPTITGTSGSSGAPGSGSSTSGSPGKKSGSPASSVSRLVLLASVMATLLGYIFML
jgi:hypothetical protein